MTTPRRPVLGPAERVTWHPAGVEHGGKREVIAFGIAITGIFHPIRLTGLANQGIFVHAHEREPRVLRFVESSGRPLLVDFRLSTTPDATFHDVAQPHVIYVDTRASDEFDVRVANMPDVGAACTPQADHLMVQPFLRLVQTEPLASLRKPSLPPFVTLFPVDVAADLQQHLDSDDSWRMAVAVAQSARLAPLGSASQPTAAAVTWVLRLEAVERDTIERLLAAEIHRLTAVASDLLADATRDELWRAEFAALCRYRDDVEAVRRILDGVEAHGSVERALDLLDSLATSLAAEPADPDSQLVLAARVQPDAWWLVGQTSV
jgi:hypothetical protein